LLYFFVNEYMGGIALGFVDSVLGCGKCLWKTRIGIGICFGMGCGKVGVYIKGREIRMKIERVGVSFGSLGLKNAGVGEWNVDFDVVFLECLDWK
jgi:hypothetical protein